MRRRVIISLLLFFTTCLPCLAADGLNAVISDKDSNLPGMDATVRKYLERWEIRGASLAVMRGDSLVYAKGYGWADKENSRAMRSSTLLRFASVSKLLTATGIMRLCDSGRLHLSDRVFARGGILHDSLSRVAADTNWASITVEHLLRHEAGFGSDPLFAPMKVKSELCLKHLPTPVDYLRYVQKKPLYFVPGTSQRYSNFGYLVLAMIIEKVTGSNYEEWMQENVLRPAGCLDMHLAGNYLADRLPGESRYYPHGEGDEMYTVEFNGSGRKVLRCYGGNDVHGLSGAGAWCGSVLDLARLVASIDGNPVQRDILSYEAVEAMTEYNGPDRFSLGWNDTNPEKGWQRTGTFAGTSALVHYFSDGECWILIMNTSTWKGPRQAKETAGLFESCRQNYGIQLPRRNLFELFFPKNYVPRIPCDDKFLIGRYDRDLNL